MWKLWQTNLSTWRVSLSWLLRIALVMSGWDIWKTWWTCEIRTGWIWIWNYFGGGDVENVNYLLSIDCPDIVHLFQSSAVSRRKTLQKTLKFVKISSNWVLVEVGQFAGCKQDFANPEKCVAKNQHLHHLKKRLCRGPIKDLILNMGNIMTE